MFVKSTIEHHTAVITVIVLHQVNFFHNNSIAIILWATSMVDTDSPNFNDSYNKGYFIR